jgi:hypothetical protein
MLFFLENIQKSPFIAALRQKEKKLDSFLYPLLSCQINLYLKGFLMQRVSSSRQSFSKSAVFFYGFYFYGFSTACGRE